MTGTHPDPRTDGDRSGAAAPRTTHSRAWTDSHLAPAERDPTVLPWLLSASGVLLVAVHLPHLYEDLERGVGLFAIVSGVVAPIVLAVGLAVAGVLLRRSTLDRSLVRRVCAWTLLGALFLLGVGGISLLYQLTEGAVLSHVPFVLGNFVTGGAIAGFIVGWFDAHGHRRRAELRGFMQAVEHTGHAVCITQTDGTIEYVNEAFVDQTGYSREAAVGATPRILNSGEQSTAFYEELWATILAGEVWRGELVNRGADGSHYHVDQTIAPVTDTTGTIERFVAINAEITALKEYEAELERNNDQLQEFARILSHDLRNPLNVATGRVELIASEVESPHLDPIQQALDRMDRLISDVLQLTLADASAQGRTEVALADVVRAAWTSVDTLDATLDVGSPGTVEGSEAQLRQLFENLLRNAVEHGGAAVTVRVDSLDDGFYVADDGAGIPPADRVDVFETGYTTSQAGTGLGLGIVSRIANTHGWNVEVTASQHDGARFEFRHVAESPIERHGLESSA